MSPKDTARILSCLIHFLSNREQGEVGEHLPQQQGHLPEGPMVGLPPLTHPDSFQFFDPKTPLLKVQLLSRGSKSTRNLRKQRAECYSSSLLVESGLAPATQGAPVKAGPAPWSDTPHLLFPCLPTSSQLRRVRGRTIAENTDCEQI